MTDQAKLALLEDMFEMDEGTLKAATEMSSIENWDSLAHLSLFVLIQDHFGKAMKSDDVKKFKTIQDILDFMG